MREAENFERFRATVARLQMASGGLARDAPSRRQLETAYLLIVEGLPYRMCACAMGISERTAQDYLARFAAKFGLSVAEARARVHREYWIAVGREVVR